MPDESAATQPLKFLQLARLRFQQQRIEAEKADKEKNAAKMQNQIAKVFLPSLPAKA